MDLFAVWAVGQPFVVTRWWAAVFTVAVIVGVVFLVHALVDSSTPGPSAVSLAEMDPRLAQVYYRRRGVKALVIGQDGRASTSKTQVVLWTFAVFYALVFLLLWGRSIGCPADPENGSVCASAAQARETFVAVTNDALHHEYYALLGLPIAAAIAAKSITSTRANEGELQQDLIDPGQGGMVDALSEIVGNDAGHTDIIDFQYFAFTLLALAYFFTEFLTAPAGGLPAIPPTLVALSGVSAGAYTAKKALGNDQYGAVADAANS